MAKWQCTIDISNACKLAQDRLILPDEIATILAKKLESVRQLRNEDDDIEIEKAAIIEELKDFSENFRLAKNNMSQQDIEEWWHEFDIMLSCVLVGSKYFRWEIS